MPAQKSFLVRPCLDYAQSWKAALDEFDAEAVSGFWYVPTKPVDIGEYIQRTEDHASGKNIPDNWMQATTFWLIDEGMFVGHVNLRHTLFEWSKKIGGHIGFAIRPSARKQGYGSRILALALIE